MKLHNESVWNKTAITICAFQLKLLMLCCLAFSVSADQLNKELQSFFNKIGGTASAVAPDHYQAQAAGYYTLGSAYMRVPTENMRLANLQLPSFSAGCGGIDVFAGSFSMVNSEQLVATGKAIASNALMYAFELAVDTVSPMIAKQIKQNLERVRDWTQFEINSCEAAKGLVDNLWSRLDTRTQSSCQNTGRDSGRFGDASEARLGCGRGTKRQKVLSDHEGKKLTNMNVAWQAILSNALIKPKQRELFMTLSGTAIIREQRHGDETAHQYSFIRPRADQADVIDALLEGGEIKSMQCDEKMECLEPKQEAKIITITPEQAFHARIKTLLSNVMTHIMKDEALDEETQTAYFQLLNKTSLPLHKMLNVNAAYHMNKQGEKSARLDVVGYSELIALDIVFSYLEDILQKVLMGMVNVEFDPVEKQRWEQAILQAKADIRQKQQTSRSNLQVAMNLVEQTQLLEQVLSGSLTNDIVNLLHPVGGNR